MKKNFKLVLALVLALMLVLGMTSALASTLTINNTAAGFTYKAYQIFTGDKSETTGSYKLSNIQWGTAIPEGNRATFLADDELETLLGVSDGGLASKTAAEMAGLFANKSGAELADIISKYATVQYGSDATYASSKYTFTGLPDGYYLVKNTAKDDTVEGNKLRTFSEFIMQVVGDTEAEAKNSSVTVDKKIDADTTDNTITSSDKVANSVAIGDTIPYIIEGTLPSNFSAYDNYYYKFSDTMKGIDYVSADVSTTTATEAAAQVLVVKANGTTTDITAKATISATNQTTKDGSTTFTVEIDNLKASTFGVTVEATDKIVVKYWGQLNNFADTGTTANINEVDLTFTNNPEQSGDGTNHEYKTAVGVTPKHQTKTYDTVLQVLKVGDNNDENPLAGAKFKLAGDNLYTVREVNGYKFVPSTYTLSTAKGTDEVFEAGTTYYALKDTNDPTNTEKYTYTTTPYSEDLDSATKAKYVDTTNATTYKKVTYTMTVTEKAANVTYTGYTGADGKLRFEGLEPGTYTLTELIAPSGYNLVSGGIQVVIAFDDTDAKKFTVTGDGTSVLDDGTVQIRINNNSGSTLPSTGGIGTTIFYIGGSILVLAAAILLITKRRMSNND